MSLELNLAFKQEWDKLNSSGIYVGGHPMTGKGTMADMIILIPYFLRIQSILFLRILLQNNLLIEFKNIIELLGANIFANSRKAT